MIDEMSDELFFFFYLKLGIIILLALCPPVGLVVVLCIVFSDGTPSGFVGCLTPFILFVIVALIIMLCK